jgi:UDP-3-O-[3-hydroxymyristoyl] N-acetylglucosamine deacetylase
VPFSSDPDAEFGGVEHVLAALAVAGVDNCTVWLRPGGDPAALEPGAWGDPQLTYEPPGLGGSARPFLEALLRGGVEEQPAARRLLVVRRAVEVRIGDSWARLEPHPGFEVRVDVDYSGAVAAGPLAAPVGLAVELMDEASDAYVAPLDFLADYAAARTFSFEGDGHPVGAAEMVARGGVHHPRDGTSPPLVAEGARPVGVDEHARHKLVDAVGDLSLAGAQIVGRFTSSRPGHATTRKLLQRFLADPRLNFYEIDYIKL